MMQQEQCKHDVRYDGVINLLHGFGITGAVDVWKCAKCGQTWCDEKRLGVQDLPAEVGLPPRKPDTEWAILVCEAGEQLEWHLMQLKVGESLEHSCDVFKSPCHINVTESSALCDLHKDGHKLFLVKDNINNSIKL